MKMTSSSVEIRDEDDRLLKSHTENGCQEPCSRSTVEHTSPEEGGVPDMERRSVLLCDPPRGSTIQSELILTVTENPAELHSSNTPSAVTTTEDRGRVRYEESKGGQVVTDAILERGDRAIPSVESVTTKYGVEDTSNTTPSSGRDVEAVRTRMCEDDIGSDLPRVEDSMRMVNDDNSVDDEYDVRMMIQRGEKNNDEVRMGQKGDDELVRKCNVRKEWCTTHGCKARSIKVTSQKWRWKNKQKEFGFVSVKTSKIICSSRQGGSKGPLSADNIVGGNTGPGVETLGSDILKVKVAPDGDV